MSTQTLQFDTRLFGREVSYGLNGSWASYWLVFLRLLTGWWFFSSGLGKIIEHGLLYDAEGWLLFGTEGTIVYPITEWFATNAVIVPNLMVPWGEFAIGLGLILGCLTRLAAANGALLMGFFYFGNADWGHGFVNGDLMGLLLFLTVIVFAAGRVWGVDAYLERTDAVKNRPWLRYLLG
ncbi:DoxX family protein [Halosolutus halophilus]|uniref:DoxX family protein n=1 Tax=Halosolutus halophilus TaxID=1552990 RepID=UPI00223516FB|nr:DoxX family protein [Halosolutus halophilus]